MEHGPAMPAAFAARFRSILSLVAPNPLLDGELLSRFVAARDEEAFAELVRRLGPSVLGVCQRFLGRTPDAEDAFQATFLVLARKAGTIQPPGRVAAWVYGAANLAARKARAQRNRRLARETAMAEVPERPTAEHALEADIPPLLYEELQRLPEKFRQPLVLCELRELTTARAAEELGWPVGTVASRLSRGRRMLADRLVRRGMTASAAIALITALPSMAAAKVPLPLMADAVSAAVAGGSCSASVLILTSEVIRAMSAKKITMICTGLVASAMLAMYGGVTMQSKVQAAPPAGKALETDPLGQVKFAGVAATVEGDQALRIVSFLHGDDDRTPSVYVETSTGVWKEFYDGGVYAVYREVANTGEYVQILDENCGLYIRFYKAQAYHGHLKSERGKYLYKINWCKGSIKG